MKKEDSSTNPSSLDESETREPRLLRSAGAIGVVTLLSRVTGLLREQCQAFFLGAGPTADAFRIAFLVPNLFRRFVGEGAMTAGLVPVLTGYVRKGDRESLVELIEKFFTLWTLILIVVTVLGMLLAGTVLAVWPVDPGAWDPAKLELASDLMWWLFFYLGLVSLSAVGQAVLNAFGIFALPSATPLLFNLAFIAAGYGLQFVFPGPSAVWSFVIGILVGGVLQCAMLVPSLWKRGVRFRPRWPTAHPGLRESFSLLVKGTFGAGIYQINVFVSVLIAMSIPLEGAVSSLGYSSRLMEFVLGVFVFGLSTVGLTAMSRHVASEDREGLRVTTSKLLRLTFFISLPSTAGLLILARPIVDLILRFGAFDGAAADLTLRAFYLHAPGLVFVGMSRSLTNVFYAFREVGVVVRAGFVNLVVNLALCLWLSRTALEHGGIALASSIAAVVQAVVLVVVLQRRKKILLPRELIVSAFKTVLATAVMAAVCYWLSGYVNAAQGKVELGLWTGATILLSAAIFFGVAWLLGGAEVRTVLRVLRRRRG